MTEKHTTEIAGAEGIMKPFAEKALELEIETVKTLLEQYVKYPNERQGHLNAVERILAKMRAALENPIDV